MMIDLTHIPPQQLNLPNADITYFEHLIAQSTANEWFEQLSSQLAWQQESIVVYGKSHFIPRLQSFYGDNQVSYQYSGKRFVAQPWHELLQPLKALVEQVTQVKFNCVLANYYRNGQDCMGWHADDEAELGKTPVIASLSFGAPRCFKLKHRLNNQQQDIELASGSLLIMAGSTQEFWYHSLPKRARVDNGRINLTFRTLYPL